jgi:putative FmdB family regulatory protein
MSLYEYVCRECRKKFQKVVPITEYKANAGTCPKCKSRNVERVWSAVNVVTSKKS